MSKIGKKPIKIPEGVDVKISDSTIKVKGPKGELEFSFKPSIKVEKTGNEIKISMKRGGAEAKMLFGTTRAQIANMIKGVTKVFEKKLELHGVGYRANVEGKNLVLNVGFSYPIKIEAVEGIEFKVRKNEISVRGIDKQKVGEIAAQIRKIRPPEPYKGKGIRYKDEQVRRKAGKVVGGEETAGVGK